MATQTIMVTNRFVRTKTGDLPPMRWFPEAASQTFVYGDLVYLSSGAVTVCGADPSSILGVAMMDASGTTGTQIPVLVITDDVEIAMSAYHATKASAVLAASNVGTAYEINQYAAGKWTIDIANTSSTRVTVVGNLDDWGDVYGRAWCQFTSANLQMSVL